MAELVYLLPVNQSSVVAVELIVDPNKHHRGADAKADGCKRHRQVSGWVGSIQNIKVDELTEIYTTH
jgi:hypothetical protein